MSKKCAKCEKTVYPAEELRCLDKSWHKQCFKCWECGMALTMKNYKGFNKLPYCNAHYPQLSATVVADTPEQRRLTQTSNMQSQAVYHADFVQNIRGTVTSMPEDNEMKRAREVGNIVSQSAYTRGQGGEDGPHGGGGTPASSTRGGSQSETSYTRPMRSYNEEESYPEAPRSYTSPAVGGGPNAGRMLPVPGSQAPPTPQPAQPTGPTYVAMYDYDAQDDDEVGFQENDRIINCVVIDEGWVTGTVQRTGQRGMIPANYIEQA